MKIFINQENFTFHERVGFFPLDWELTEINKKSRLYSGGTPSTSESAFFGGDNIWLVPSDITALENSVLYIKEGKTNITNEGVSSCSTIKIQAGSVCLSSRATIGECAIAAVDLYTNQGFINISCNDDLHPVYFLYWIKQNKDYISRYAAGTTFLEISRRTFGKLKVALPKHNEQTAIATILSKVDEAIETTQNSIKAAEKLKRALMQNLLMGKLRTDGTWRKTDEFQMTKIGLIPKEWKIKTVKEISTQVTDGEHTTPERSESGFYLLSARNIKNSYLDLSNVDYVKEEELRKIQKRCNPQAGDIIISCSGTIGNVCMVPEGLDAGMVRSAALIKLKKDEIEPEFAELVFQSFSLQNQMKVSVASSVQGNIFQGAIRKLKIPYPPDVEERTQITQKIKGFSALIIEKQTKIQNLQRLKKSLMQNLLTGKVRLTKVLIKQFTNG